MTAWHVEGKRVSEHPIAHTINESTAKFLLASEVLELRYPDPSLATATSYPAGRRCAAPRAPRARPHHHVLYHKQQAKVHPALLLTLSLPERDPINRGRRQLPKRKHCLFLVVSSKTRLGARTHHRHPKNSPSAVLQSCTS